MENIDKILALKNIDVRRLAVDLILIVISGSLLLLIGPFISGSLPTQIWIFSLTSLKAPIDGVAIIIWVFFTFILFLLLKLIASTINRFNIRSNWLYAPPLKLSGLIYQGWLGLRGGEEIYLTNSNSGLLFNKPWVKNSKVKFKFNFEYLETAVIRGIYNNTVEDKIHKFNFLGFIFRAQSLEDYFMLSIGVQVNVEDYESQRKKGEFEVIITPHIKLNGNWERLGGRYLGTKIKIDEFVPVECVISEETATIEINNHSLTWNLSTNFDGAIVPRENIKSDELVSTKSTQIPFRLQSGMLGFRSYLAEHAIIKDVVITRI